MLLKITRYVYHIAKYVQLRCAFFFKAIYIGFHTTDVKLAKNRKRRLAGDVVVITLMKNEELFINDFINHYLDLRVDHIVILDNGSSDRTIEIARQFNSVSVVHCELNYRIFENAFRYYLAKRFGRGSWIICADADELLLLPETAKNDIHFLTSRLEGSNYNSVLCYMFDVFPNLPLSDLDAQSARFKDLHIYFDTSDFNEYYYTDVYPLNTERCGMKIITGGIRKKVFGFSPLLTKHSLFKLSRFFLPYGSHHAAFARVADFNLALAHYKFAGDFYNKSALAVASGNYWQNSKEPRAYAQKLSEVEELCLYDDEKSILFSQDAVEALEFFEPFGRSRLASLNQTY